MDAAAGIVWTEQAGRWHDVLPPLLDDARLIDSLTGHEQVLIKPNLVEAPEPPGARHCRAPGDPRFVSAGVR